MEEEIESTIEQTPQMMSFSTREGPQGGEGPGKPSSSNPSTGGGATGYYHKYTYVFDYYKWDKSLDVFCGVPAWLSGPVDDAALHFGEVVKTDTKYTGEDDIFNTKFNFFTYDPTPDGMGTFRWPFFISNNGTLSNMWAGCEPVCEIVSRLLGGGFFFGLPWNKGVGYTFRPNVPKLVFVFSNEFDNSMNMTFDLENGFTIREGVVVPGVTKSALTFYTTGSGLLGTDTNPPDPYCVRLFAEGDLLSDNENVNKVRRYLKDIGLKEKINKPGDEVKAALDAAKSLQDNFINGITKSLYTNPKAAEYSYKNVTNSLSVKCSPNLNIIDLDRKNNPFSGMRPLELLTDE